MIPLIQVPLNLDLTEFTQFLWANEVPHRVTEDEQQQTIWVPHTVNSERLQQIFEHWRQGGELEELRVRRSGRSLSEFSPDQLMRVPVTLGLILTSVLASLWVGFGTQYDALSQLSFSDFEVRGNQLYYANLPDILASGEYWRIWTPIFVHFSSLHILFNLLWVWVFGRKVERLQGKSSLILLVVFSGAMSNLAQFLVSGPLFGGMSGVVFALLAYTWCWDKLNHRPIYGFPPMLMGFMLFWLALGYTGALEAMGLGAIANTAHLVGLISGVLFALFNRTVLNVLAR